MAKKDAQSIQAELARPFAPEDLEWRLQRTFESRGQMAGIAVPYVTNRAIMNRLHDKSFRNSCNCAAGSSVCIFDPFICPGILFQFLIQLQQYLCVFYAVTFSSLLHQFFNSCISLSVKVTM